MVNGHPYCFVPMDWPVFVLGKRRSHSVRGGGGYTHVTPLRQSVEGTAIETNGSLTGEWSRTGNRGRKLGRLDLDCRCL